ncbi:hypothetical protein [Rhizobium sp. 21-4511-3d]
MADREGYTNTDELKADDEISPRPSRSAGGDATKPATTNAHEGDDDAQRVPRPATSK